MPPHVESVSLQPERVLITFSPDFDARIAKALGGRQRSSDFGAWEFPAPSIEAAGALLERIRDLGIPFRWMEGGWPPAAVFEELRERGVVAGPVRALSYYGSDRWTLRDL